MLDHVSLGVADLARAVGFYDRVLAPLGYVRLWASERGAGYGPEGAAGEPFALFAAGEWAHPPGSGWHLALAAASRAAVRDFHAAAIASGGRSEGEPGLRTQYGPSYYAAFIRDLDGYKIEAVCHRADEGGSAAP